MPKLRIPGSRGLANIVALSAVLTFLVTPRAAQAQANDKIPPTAAQNPTPLTLKATSNLVIVRVVVRDENGKPLENLKKEDFHLFDRGKEQTITQFDVETSTPMAGSTVQPATPNSLPLPAAAPGRFLALYFDDLNSSDADMIQARDAADHYLFHEPPRPGPGRYLHLGTDALGLYL